MLNLGIADRGKEKPEEKWNKGCDATKSIGHTSSGFTVRRIKE